jgi:protein tyrosine/serine phosphatase
MAVLIAVSAGSMVMAGSGKASTVQVENFGRVDPGYYRGAQPKGHDYRDLAFMGIKMVIDLEVSGDRDEAGQVKAAGMRFYRIPMSDHSRPSAGAVQQFLELVNDPSNQPVFVHCHGGRHRTGAMTAVYRMTHDGWNATQAYDEMKRYNFTSMGGHGVLKDYVYEYYSQMGRERIAATQKAASSDTSTQDGNHSGAGINPSTRPQF